MTRAQQTSALLPTGIPGSGGNASITCNVTLTLTSAGAMVVTPASPGLCLSGSMTLVEPPDSPTMDQKSKPNHN